MPLMSLWSSNPEAVAELTIEQIVSAAGDGNLKDRSVCAAELREYFSRVSGAMLGTYVKQCLSGPFSNSGLVLQDLINEVGRRLGYSVINGLYRGRRDAIGFDGIWVAPEGHYLVVEVKTTDVYRISLDTIAAYRRDLLNRARILAPSSILIVVGRGDTGELEAQVRGSRHSWDVRLISAEALLDLAGIERIADPDVGQKIRSLLVPWDYIKLDEIVDMMFTTVDADPPSGQSSEHRNSNGGHVQANEKPWRLTRSVVLQRHRTRVISAVVDPDGPGLVDRRSAV